MRRFLLAALLVLAMSAQSRATDEVIETCTFRAFKIAAGENKTLKLVDFDFDGDGDLDMQRVYQIAFFSSDGEDSVAYHADQGYWVNPIKASTDNVIPLRTKRFSEIKYRPAPSAPAWAAPADSMVIRYHAMGSGAVYLYVWGN